MRNVNEWFDNYSAHHRKPINTAIHWICVPAILWSVIAALWVIPVPAILGRAGFWAGAGMFFALTFYFKLARSLGLAMLLLFMVLGLITEGLYRAMGSSALVWLAVSVFITAWIGQFIGHLFEGRRPSFFTDLAYLLIGPAWLVGKVMKRWGIHY